MKPRRTRHRLLLRRFLSCHAVAQRTQGYHYLQLSQSAPLGGVSTSRDVSPLHTFNRAVRDSHCATQASLPPSAVAQQNAQRRGKAMKAAEAAKKADVSRSTITRWVQAGTLSARRLASGELEIEESELDEFLAGRTSAPRQGGASNSAVALAVAEERIRGLELMVATYQGWLKESEGRLQFVLQALPPAPPAPPARRPWWRIW